jgi:hypothetical protein
VRQTPGPWHPPQLPVAGCEGKARRPFRTPHSLRRTYAGLRVACGDDPIYGAEQLGHSDMNLTFKVYQRPVKAAVEALRAPPGGVRPGARMGTSADLEVPQDAGKRMVKR